MKNLMFKLGAIMLIVAMLLCCFVACGEEGKENGEDAEGKVETKPYQVGGVTLNYPVNLKIMTETADMVMLLDAKTGQSIQVITSKSDPFESVEEYRANTETVTKEKFYADVVPGLKKETQDNPDYTDVKVELLSIVDERLCNYKIEMTMKGMSGTYYTSTFHLPYWDQSSLTINLVTITVLDTTADRPIANGLFN